MKLEIKKNAKQMPYCIQALLNGLTQRATGNWHSAADPVDVKKLLIGFDRQKLTLLLWQIGPKWHKGVTEKNAAFHSKGQNSALGQRTDIYEREKKMEQVLLKTMLDEACFDD